MRENIISLNYVITKHILLGGPVLLSATLPEVSSNPFGLITLQIKGDIAGITMYSAHLWISFI